MNPLLRNVFAVVAGVAIGGIANMGIITLSGLLIPPPEGVNPNDLESIKANIHLYQPIHFLMPWLAHAVGSFVGALVAALIAVSHKMKFAMGVGAWTMVGGIAASFMIPAPTWFIVADLALAYIPMAFLAGKLATGKG
ncbi:MAG: hypothetical protein K9J17_15875 [Flavobacteriales bacterium]|nr:hypothetical protein [Flavobacteriales bacterium]